MRDILVIGGTLFFGKRLVRSLVGAGEHVTVLSRGRVDDGLGEQVERIVCDREEREQLVASLAERRFDVVYDQVCYDSRGASALVEAIGDRAGRLVFMSTGAVYEPTGSALVESEFEPTNYPIRDVHRSEVSYAEGKRLAEAVFFQTARCPVAALRCPIVIGRDDYTERLARLIERVREGEVLRVADPDVRISLVTSDDAARQLEWLGWPDRDGPFNGTTSAMSYRELIERIAEWTGGDVRFESSAERDPFGMDRSSNLSTAKAERLGFTFGDAWPVIESLARG